MNTPLTFYNMITGGRTTANDWQMALGPGDCFVIESPISGLVNIKDGEPDPSTAQVFDTTGLIVYVEIKSPASNPGFFWCKAYSQWEPRGDLEVHCIVDATRPITRDEFKAALKTIQE